MRLLDAKNLTRSGLGEAALLDEPVDAQGEVRLQLLALGVRKSEVGEDVTAA